MTKNDTPFDMWFQEVKKEAVRLYGQTFEQVAEFETKHFTDHFEDGQTPAGALKFHFEE